LATNFICMILLFDFFFFGTVVGSGAHFLAIVFLTNSSSKIRVPGKFLCLNGPILTKNFRTHRPMTPQNDNKRPKKKAFRSWTIEHAKYEKIVYCNSKTSFHKMPEQKIPCVFLSSSSLFFPYQIPCIFREISRKKVPEIFRGIKML
jgi:hypothetical protein